MSTVEHPRQKTFCPAQLGEVSYTTYDNVSGSPTKLKYSFGMSRATRFPVVKLRNHEQVGYDLPTTKKARAAGFGIGDRFQDQAVKLKRNQNPSPDRYNIPTVFRPDNTTSTFANHMKGEMTYSFGTGREGFSKTVYNERVGNNKRLYQPDPVVPGPGTYESLHPIGVGSKSFKLKGKIAYGSVSYNGRAAERKGVPGAGTYEDTLSLNNVGVYNLNSQWSNSKAQKWSPPFDRFFRPRVTTDENPGPGQHEQFGEIHKGKQVNTKFHSTKTPSFGIGGRARWTQRFQTPGPGAYRPPSDFGYVNIGKYGESAAAMTPYKSQMSQIEAIPENAAGPVGSPARMRLEKQLKTSVSHATSPKGNERQNGTPSKFRQNRIHKRKSSMNPTMALTQDMKQLGLDTMDVPGPRNIHPQAGGKINIKRNINNRTMRNTITDMNGYNTAHVKNNMTPNVTHTTETDELTRTIQPKPDPRGLNQSNNEIDEQHCTSLMTPNNMSLMTPNIQGSLTREDRDRIGATHDQTTASAVDSVPIGMTPAGPDFHTRDKGSYERSGSYSNRSVGKKSKNDSD